MADASESIGVEYPALEPAQQQALREALGPLVALANPLDYHTYIWDDLDAMTAAFAAMMQGEADISCLLLDFPRNDRCRPDSWYTAVEALGNAARQTGRVGAILATLPENLGEADAAIVVEHGLVPLCGVNDALQAIVAAAVCGAGLRLAPEPLALPQVLKSSEPHGHGAQQEISEQTEFDAKKSLAEAGLRIPQAIQISSQSAAADAEPDARINSLDFPVVLKAQGLAHKSEVGGVVTGIATPADLHRELAEMHARLQKQQLISGDSFLIEQQVGPVVAELLVSVIRDPAIGLMMTLAAGGIHTELLRDHAHLLLPASRSDIVQALDSLRVSMLLDGYRGAAPVNRETLLSAITSISHYALEHKDSLLELEVNPILCTPQEAVVGDAILRFVN